MSNTEHEVRVDADGAASEEAMAAPATDNAHGEKGAKEGSVGESAAESPRRLGSRVRSNDSSDKNHDSQMKTTTRAEPEAEAEAEAATKPETGTDDASALEPSRTLRISNFRRPFTLNAVKARALVQELGPFADGGFWMNAIKTHCFVTYVEATVARRTMAALQGRVWPPETGQALEAQLATAEEVIDGAVTARGSDAVSTSTDAVTSRHPADTARSMRSATSIDSFFLKTVTKPVLYYLPLTDEEVRARKGRDSGEPGTKRRTDAAPAVPIGDARGRPRRRRR